MQYLSKAEREELSNLSKEIFGTRSAWQGILKNGVLQPFTEPGSLPSRTPKYMTIAELKENMQKLKIEIAEYKVKIAAEAAAKAELEAAKVAETRPTEKVVENV